MLGAIFGERADLRDAVRVASKANSFDGYDKVLTAASVARQFAATSEALGGGGRARGAPRRCWGRSFASATISATPCASRRRRTRSTATTRCSRPRASRASSRRPRRRSAAVDGLHKA